MHLSIMKIDSQYSEKFETRHIGPDDHQVASMLMAIKAKSVDDLINETIPAGIRLKKPLNLPIAKSEYDFLQAFKAIASRNKVCKSYIGHGLHTLSGRDCTGAAGSVDQLSNDDH
jgi:glycine dehydrogenase